jgi:hypothetical protein
MLGRAPEGRLKCSPTLETEREPKLKNGTKSIKNWIAVNELGWNRWMAMTDPQGAKRGERMQPSLP